MTKREQFLKVLQTDVPSICGKQLIIWGMGNTARLYQEGLRRLEKEGFCIYAYCDSHVKEPLFMESQPSVQKSCEKSKMPA